MNSAAAMVKMNVVVVDGAAAFGRRGGRSCGRVKAAAAATATAGVGFRSGSSGVDYYKVLSLERTAEVGAEDVKRAYRRLARRYHPDACPPARRAESTELFLELRSAYETLSDPALRVRYDAELRRATGGAARPSPAGGCPRDVWEAQLCVLRARSERRQKQAGSGAGRRYEPAA